MPQKTRYRLLKLQQVAKIITRNTLALFHGSEAWKIEAKDKSRMTLDKMKLMRHITKCTLKNYRRNQDILEE